MLVDVSLNGQHLQVKAELVQFSPLEGKVGEFIISAGKLECKIHSGLVFILRHQNIEDPEAIALGHCYEFILACHCFTALKLKYSDKELYSRVNDFMEKLCKIPPPPKFTRIKDDDDVAAAAILGGGGKGKGGGGRALVEADYRRLGLIEDSEQVEPFLNPSNQNEKKNLNEASRKVKNVKEQPTNRDHEHDYGCYDMQGLSIQNGNFVKKNFDELRLCKVNSDYSVCSTYPQVFIVPKGISDAVIRHAAKFRAKGRLPIISYRSQAGSCIVRSSQALVGLQKSRSVQDERLIGAIKILSPRKSLLIVDARSSKSALANSITGGGFMPLENYENCERVYLGIENIHSVRNSYLAIFKGLLSGCSIRTAKVDAGWTKHYETIMEGVNLIVNHLNMGWSVLVHCSDGWDRTAQLVSLAQIFLDPFTRSITGFSSLIQREWVAAGHQFETRLARSLSPNTLRLPSNSPNFSSRVLSALSLHTTTISSGGGSGEDGGGTINLQDEFCPIFPQFLDCILQLLRVYPDAFEFDNRLIDALWKEVYLTQSDTFRFNSEQERSAAIQSPLCFWEHLALHHNDFLNLNFTPIGQLSVTKDLLFYL